MKKYTHNQALFIILMQHVNKWVPIYEVRDFTKKHSGSECFNVNSRASDLRIDYGYKDCLYNSTKPIGGKNHSCYMIKLSEREISVIRKLWKKHKRIPKYSEVQNQLQPVQPRMFAEVV